MTFNAMTERYEEITVCGKPALFTSIRIKRDTIPDGLYACLLYTSDAADDQERYHSGWSVRLRCPA